VEHCAAATANGADFALWRRFLRGCAVAAVLGGVALVGVNVLPLAAAAEARQPPWYLATWLLAAVAAVSAMLWAPRRASPPRTQLAVLSVAILAGFSYTGAVLNTRARSGNDLSPALVELKARLSGGSELVSFGRVYHRFAYVYETPIRQVPWPNSADDLPPEVAYFCFDRRPGDTPDDRAGNDDRLGAHTSGTLPFAWEKIAEVACDPVKREQAHRTVVIGRVRRDPRVAVQSAVSRPARR
jgi:hypothetical protein